jgi:hypothetical protein
MANRQTTFLLKRSNVPGKIPSSSGLTLGELALNTADAILYTSGTTANNILPIGWDRIHRTGDTVTGDFNFFGDITISGSSLPNGYALAVTGDTNLGGDVFVQGNLNYSGDVLVTGSTIIQNGLTANTIYTDYIDFNQTYSGATTQGRINWDSGTGTLNVGIGDTTTGLIDLQVGQEEVVRVFNDEATTLLKGEIVYVSGSQGNRPKVKRASATSDGYSVTTLGMVDRNILSGNEGYVTTFGIISNLNTLGLTGGTAIWLSPTTPGGYTETKPQAPFHTVLIGYVVRVSATVGSIFINISNGWELDELHDVRISAATEGDLLVRSSFSGTPVWINTKTLPGNYTITGNTTIGGNLTVSGNSGVNWFSGNTSTDMLRVTQTGSGNAFVVEDSSNPDTSPFVITSGGSVGIGTTVPDRSLDIAGATRIQQLLTLTAGLTSTGGLLTSQTATNSGRMSLLNLRNTGGGYTSALNSSLAIAFTNRDTSNVWSDDFIELKVYDSGTTTSRTGYNFYTHNNQLFNNPSVLAMSINGQNVGIGNENPSERLDVSGKTRTTNFQMTSGATSGYFLTTDGSGNASWSPINVTTNDLDPVLSVLTTEPTPLSSSTIGDRYLIGTGATGTWLGKDNQIAEYTGITSPNWSYTSPVADNVVYVTDTLVTYYYNGTNWIAWRGTAILQNGNSLSTAVNIGSNNNQNLTFRTSGQTRMLISGSTGNVGINTTNPRAKLEIKATDNLSTTKSLSVRNSADTKNLFSIGNNGGIEMTHPTFSGTNAINITGDNVITYSSANIGSYMVVGAGNVINFGGQLIQTNGGAILGTVRTGTPYILNLNQLQTGITGGSATFQGVLVNPTINFTGTYSGDVIGYNYNPTVTSIANGRHIAMQIVRGDIFLNTVSGNTGIGTTSPRQKLDVSGNTIISSGLTAQTAVFSSSSQSVLTVIGSGNSTTSPLFSVQGSSGELFSVTDSLTGSLFSVNDISGLPIVEVFSDNTTLMGSYLAPSLNTTTRTSLTAGTNTVYSIPTSAYTGAFFEYTLISTGSTGARAGQIMSIWSGTSAQYTETTTNDIGTTTGVTFSVAVSGNNAVLSSSATTTGWTLKTIVRSI